MFKPIFIILIITLFASCGIYQPQSIDIPLISKKNDLVINAGVSVTPPSANATISYGLTNKLAVQVYGNIDSEDGSYLQSALGYYKVLSNQKVMEIYGGFGYGYNSFRLTSTNRGPLYGNYQLYFMQLNYGTLSAKNKNIDYGVGFKMGYMPSSFTDDHYFDRSPEYIQLLTYKNNSILIEPAAFIRFGGKHLKLNCKLGACWIYQFTNRDNILPYWIANLGIGINYRF